MSEASTNLNTERIYFLPNDMFERDTESEMKAPELVKDVPQYKFEQFLHLMPLAKRLGEIKEEKTLNTLGFGQGGFVFQFKDAKRDWAIKLVFNENLPEFVLDNVLDTVALTNEDKGEVKDRYSKLSDYEDNALLEVGGFVLGHSAAPDNIVLPESVFTFNGIPIGFALPTIYGEGIDLDIDDPDTKKLIVRLENAGVRVDTIGIHNAIKVREGQQESVKVVDLRVEDEVLENDPRVLHPGEKRVARTDNEKDVRIKEMWMDLASYRINSAELRMRLQEVYEGDAVYTFEDVLEGKAIKISLANYESTIASLDMFDSFIDLLQHEGVMLDQSETYLMHTDDHMGIEISPWGVSGDSHFHNKKLMVGYKDFELQKGSFFYANTDYQSSDFINEHSVECDEDDITYTLRKGDSEPKSLRINRQTREVSYAEGPRGQDSSYKSLEDASEVLQQFQNVFLLTDFSNPEQVFDFVLKDLSK